jgi:F-type H+-transporting ATPase subunit b
VGILAVVQDLAASISVFATEAEGGAGLTINFFWIIVSSLNFIVFFYLVYRLVLVPVGGMLNERKEKIEQGLQDADAARRDREAAADQRQAVLTEARREAADILVRGQKMSEEARDKGITDTQVEIERLRQKAVLEIDAERQRALADVRGQVAELALQAAGKLVGETMNGDREKRLVDQFLTEVSAPAPSGDNRN